MPRIPLVSEDFDGRLRAMVHEGMVSKRREAAETAYRDLSSDTVKVLRARAKKDPFFLATALLEYRDLTIHLHGHLAMWMRRTQDVDYRIILLPRDHYKSSIATITDSVRLSLPDDAGDAPYPASLGPNIKILLAHETKESAAKFLFEIQKAFLEKPMMLALFPECVPSARRQLINKWQLELPRTSHHKETTFETIGTGGAAQGRHYNFLKLDDLIGDEARDSPKVMEDSIRWFDNILSLLTDLALDKWDLIGTFWGPGDIYAHAMKQYGIHKKRSRLIRPELFEDNESGVVAYVRGAEEAGLPIFPEKFPPAKLALLKKNPQVWAAQYANDPMASGLQEFQEAWNHFYNVSGSNLVIFTGDRSERINVWEELDRIIMVDPSMGADERSDHTGIVVTGTDRRERHFILQTLKERMLPDKLVQTIFELNSKWHPRIISIEAVAFSSMLKSWIEREAKDLRNYPPVVPFPPEWARRDFYRKQKDSRIRSLIPYFSSGQVFMQQGMVELRDELRYFPIGSRHPGDHLIDALAQGPVIWQRGVPSKQVEKWKKAEEELMAVRDPLTGY